MLVANLFRVASNDSRKKFVDLFLVLPLLLSSQFSKLFLCFCENSTWFWIACFWSQNGIKVEIFEKISKKRKDLPQLLFKKLYLTQWKTYLLQCKWYSTSETCWKRHAKLFYKNVNSFDSGPNENILRSGIFFESPGNALKMF